MSQLRAQTFDAASGATVSTPATLTIARIGLWALFVTHVVAIWGTQWDIQWHLRIGRDSFWIAPHVMTYSGVTGIVLASFGVLAWTTWTALRGGDRALRTISVFGISGTRGYHVAAWGIALTVLAAPIDDLWHRLFGLDVTLWSPPHLLGLLGATINSAACWLIAREVYPDNRWARNVAMAIASGLVYGGFGFALQPSIRIGYTYGGLLFFTYPMLGALLLPLALVVGARISGLRAAPLLALVIVFVIGVLGGEIARAGFAWLQPVSFIAEEIAKDPTSPIAVSHEMARKNGARPGAYNPAALMVTVLAGLVMLAVDARRRPVLASLALGTTLFVGVTLALTRMPAFAGALPSMPTTALAAVITVLAALAGGVIASRATEGDDRVTITFRKLHPTFAAEVGPPRPRRLIGP